jgi:predicted nucleotidyltransferase
MKFGLDSETLKKIAAVLASFPQVEETIVYGSRAKGTFKPGSDIDLTLKGENLDLQILNQIRNSLHLLNTPYTFDVSIFKNIENEALIEHINRIGKAL